jgi:hypothetical protein
MQEEGTANDTGKSRVGAEKKDAWHEVPDIR